MAPDTRPSIQGAPAALPLVSAQPDAGGLNPATAVPFVPQPAAPVGSTQSTAGLSNAEQVAAQAKQILSQYSHDPYKLTGALQQLKMDYLQKQYGIELKTEN